MDTNQAIAIIQTVLASHLKSTQYRCIIFGSRATGHARKYSDMDIGIDAQNPISSSILSSIEEDIEQSDIPFRVDVVDFSTVTPDFRSQAQKYGRYLN